MYFDLSIYAAALPRGALVEIEAVAVVGEFDDK
jgi:hypothetical protein